MTNTWKEIIDLLKKLNKIENINIDEIEEDQYKKEIVEKRVQENSLKIVDPNHIMAVEFTGEKLIRFVCSMISKEEIEKEIRIPTLETMGSPEQSFHSAIYSAEYLQIIWKFADKVSEKIRLTIGTNLPLKAEVGPNITFLLAPRVETW